MKDTVSNQMHHLLFFPREFINEKNSSNKGFQIIFMTITMHLMINGSIAFAIVSLNNHFYLLFEMYKSILKIFDTKLTQIRSNKLFNSFIILNYNLIYSNQMISSLISFYDLKLFHVCK